VSLTNRIVGQVTCDGENCGTVEEMDAVTAYQLIKMLTDRWTAHPRRWSIQPAVNDRSLPWFERHGVRHLCPSCTKKARSKKAADRLAVKKSSALDPF
jgi:hypothetical protein